MSKQKIAVFGASGFVGSALIDRLYFSKEFEFKPFIHSFGNAGRLARFPISLTPVDVLDFNQVDKALSGCSVVVNCSRGDDVIMIKGLKNIIKASRKNRIEKFVHLGSIAIYGKNPPEWSSKETGHPEPGDNAYGVMKLKQDEMIFEMHASGIPSIIICPSNISGPYSIYMLGAIQNLLANKIALVDEGRYPTNLIHVDNLVEAMLSAVKSDKGWGERYFINEPEKATWKDFYEELMQMLNLEIELSSITRNDVLQKMEAKSNVGFMSNLSYLMSSDVRKALSVMPAYKKFEKFASDMFYKMSPDMQDKVRFKLTGPRIIHKEIDTVDLGNPFIQVQVRQFYHSPEKIMSGLGYKPLLNYQKRRETTESWLNFVNIMNQYT